MPKPTSPLVCVVALGCPKNLVDSEQLAAGLSRAGYRLTASPRAADLIVVTTCAFLHSAVEESETKVRELLALKIQRPELKLAVAGCLVQRYGAPLKKRLPGVDYLVSVAEMPRLAALLASRRAPSASAAQGQATVRCGTQPALPRFLSTPRHYAYLKIADGCDNRCSYCLIPRIRGPRRSRPMPEVIREAEQLARVGVKELILVAQDTTAYGLDIYRRPALSRLLKRLATIPSLRWLRLMYTHPAHVTDSLLRQFKTNPKLCRYIDLPVQHVSDRILRRMNRRCTRRQLESLIARIRAIPDMRIRTTMIVGFPGETESEFCELLDFIRAARFDRLGAYAFSPEPGTKAARMAGQVPAAVRRERLDRLMRMQARISGRRLRELIGRELLVLCDRPDAGRTEWDAPEIDGTVKLHGTRVRPGTFVRACITRAGTHDLHGTLS